MTGAAATCASLPIYHATQHFIFIVKTWKVCLLYVSTVWATALVVVGAGTMTHRPTVTYIRLGGDDSDTETNYTSTDSDPAEIESWVHLRAIRRSSSNDEDAAEWAHDRLDRMLRRKKGPMYIQWVALCIVTAVTGITLYNICRKCDHGRKTCPSYGLVDACAAPVLFPLEEVWMCTVPLTCTTCTISLLCDYRIVASFAFIVTVQVCMSISNVPLIGNDLIV
jgi:hypothetical protein